METMLLWGLGLLGVAFLLFVIEVFVPSGGVIAVTAAVVAIAGVVCLFRHDTVWGIAGLLAVLLLTPMLFMLALKIWPSTPIGQRMMYGDATPEDRQRRQRVEFEAREARQALVGAEGVVQTDLRPVGVVKIDGVRHDALAEIGLIEAGQRVVVVSVTDNQIKVRAV